MRKKFPGIYTRPNPQRQVFEQPIRTKILSNQPIKWNLKTIMNGLPWFSRAFHWLHDFHFEFWLANHNTLASVIGSVIPLIGFTFAQSVCLWKALYIKTKTMHSTCPNRSNHLLQNARVPKFSLMTFSSCLALGNLENGMHINYVRITVHSYN